MTINRHDGSMTLSAGVALSPELNTGKPIGISLKDTQWNKKLLLSYQSDAWKFSQVSNKTDIHGSGVFFIWSGIRFEPPSINDVQLQRGAYLTDMDFRPIIIIDKTGTIRYLDTTITWKVTTEWKLVIYTLMRDGRELGQMIISGDMVTHWKTK